MRQISLISSLLTVCDLLISSFLTVCDLQHLSFLMMTLSLSDLKSSFTLLPMTHHLQSLWGVWSLTHQTQQRMKRSTVQLPVLSATLNLLKQLIINITKGVWQSEHTSVSHAPSFNITLLRDCMQTVCRHYTETSWLCTAGAQHLLPKLCAFSVSNLRHSAVSLNCAVVHSCDCSDISLKLLCISTQLSELRWCSFSAASTCMQWKWNSSHCSVSIDNGSERQILCLAYLHATVPDCFTSEWIVLKLVAADIYNVLNLDWLYETTEMSFSISMHSTSSELLLLSHSPLSSLIICSGMICHISSLCQCITGIWHRRSGCSVKC